MTTTATATGGDRDHPAQGKLDHWDKGASDCYRSGGGDKTWDGSGGSGSGRGGGNSNRKMEEEEIQRQRRIYTYDGGFCFKARLISIKYV